MNSKKELLDEISRLKKKLEDIKKDNTIFCFDDNLKKFFKYNNLPLSIMDINGNYIAANHSFCALTGYNEKELLNTNCINMLHKANIKNHLKYLALIKNKKIRFYTCENQYIGKNDKLIYVRDIHNIYNYKNKQYIIKQTHDIWLEKQIDKEKEIAEKKLWETEYRYSRMIYNAEVGYFYIDKKGVIQDVNNAWLKLHKYNSENEVLGMNFRKTVFKDKNVFEQLKNCMNSHDVSLQPIEYTRKCKDKTIGYNTLSASPVMKDKKIIGIDGFIIDTTERKKSADQLHKMYEDAVKDAEIKSILLNEVNHRVKNNLSAIMGILYAERRFAVLNNKKIYNTIIEKMLNRISGLSTAHNLLSSSNWQPIELDKLVIRIINACIHHYKNRHLTLNINNTDLKINADQAHHLALVINELATNTFKYSEINDIIIDVDIIKKNSDHVCIMFKDNGKGYPEDVLNESKFNMGLELIHNITAKSLCGILLLKNSNGACASINFKINKNNEK